MLIGGGAAHKACVGAALGGGRTRGGEYYDGAAAETPADLGGAAVGCKRADSDVRAKWALELPAPIPGAELAGERKPRRIYPVSGKGRATTPY